MIGDMGQRYRVPLYLPGCFRLKPVVSFHHAPQCGFKQGNCEGSAVCIEKNKVPVPVNLIKTILPQHPVELLLLCKCPGVAPAADLPYFVVQVSGNERQFALASCRGI